MVNEELQDLNIEESADTSSDPEDQLIEQSQQQVLEEVDELISMYNQDEGGKDENGLPAPSTTRSVQKERQQALRFLVEPGSTLPVTLQQSIIPLIKRPKDEETIISAPPPQFKYTLQPGGMDALSDSFKPLPILNYIPNNKTIPSTPLSAPPAVEDVSHRDQIHQHCDEAIHKMLDAVLADLKQLSSKPSSYLKSLNFEIIRDYIVIIGSMFKTMLRIFISRVQAQRAKSKTQTDREERASSFPFSSLSNASSSTLISSIEKSCRGMVKILQNILHQPTNETYRMIRTDNEKIKSLLIHNFSFDVFDTIMKLAHFTPTYYRNSSQQETDQAIFSASATATYILYANEIDVATLALLSSCIEHCAKYITPQLRQIINEEETSPGPYLTIPSQALVSNNDTLPTKKQSLQRPDYQEQPHSISRPSRSRSNQGRISNDEMMRLVDLRLEASRDLYRAQQRKKMGKKPRELKVSNPDPSINRSTNTSSYHASLPNATSSQTVRAGKIMDYDKLKKMKANMESIRRLRKSKYDARQPMRRTGAGAPSSAQGAGAVPRQSRIITLDDLTKMSHEREMLKQSLSAKSPKTSTNYGPARLDLLPVEDGGELSLQHRSRTGPRSMSFASLEQIDLTRLGPECVRLTNIFRAKNGKPPVKWHHELAAIGYVVAPVCLSPHVCGVFLIFRLRTFLACFFQKCRLFTSPQIQTLSRYGAGKSSF